MVTAAALVAFAINSAFLSPMGRDLGYLWTDLLAIAGFTVVSSRMWTRWRHALIAGEAKLRKIFELSPDVITIVNVAEGRLSEVNDPLPLTGYTREEVLGTWRASDGMMFADHAQAEEFGRKVLEQRLVRDMEVRFRRKDGSTVPCLLSATLSEVGGERSVVAFARDISAIKRTEQDLIEAREAALAASRAKSEFLSSMSHEIRTPMNAILGMADLLAETRLTDEQRRFVETMVNNGNALLDLINDILDLAKVESGRLNLEETDFDLGELVELVAQTFGVRAHEKGLELLFRIMPGVPTHLVGDPLRLRQIMVNLVGNAIKFTERGEVLLTVENDRDASGLAALRFSVHDTGIGISPEQIESIFQSFAQADSSTTRKFGGSGLGLSIARRLAELMNGRIWVESQVGKGSVFHFTACFGISQGEHADAASLDLDGVRVLVVDDNATNRLILREILTRRGAEVHEACGGKEALSEVERARAHGTPHRLILLDCRMPEMDGFEVARRLRREPHASRPTILMLTSDDMNHQLARVREVGIDAYVVKPIKRAELSRAIALVLHRAEKAQNRDSQVPTCAAASSARALKILLVEDSRDNRLLIEAYLRSLPYALDPAENGAVAVEKFLRNAYDLVLMDMQMPVMDGLTATRRMRQWEHERGRAPTPIVALTASALEENVRQSMEAGCTAHVNKPVKKLSLLNVIRELTDSSAKHGATDARPPGDRSDSPSAATRRAAE
jgi:PAS domain S-box-containing protein